MPPTTRTTDPLQYVLESVLKATEEKDPYRLALTAAGASTIDDLLELTREDLISITWQDSDTQQEGSLPIAKVNVLLSICSWFRSQPDTSDTVFLELTAEKLKEYRRSLSHAPTAQDTASALVALSPSTSKLSPADEFKKGIKRDVNAFKPFKDRKNWNPWYRGFQAIAKAQGLGNVLDPTYEPTTPEEEALFQVLQDYTFAVFTHCLHEAQASNLVRNYSGPLAGDQAGNAQLLHMELVKLMSTGISARTQRTNIESKLMRLRLDRNWTKSINSFLVHFAHQVKDLRELRDPADASSYSDVWCMSALDTALSPHQEMSSHVSSLATSRSAIQVALGNKEQLPTLTFMEYLSQLTDHAIVLDNRNTQNSNSGPYPVRQQQRSAHSTRTSQNSAKDQHSKPAQPGMSGRNDPTDPSIWLSDREFQKLTNEQKRIRKERHRARRQQRNSASAGTATPPSHAQQVPTSIAVNATNASAAATGGPSSTPSPVSTQPASVLRNMMSTRSTRGDSSVANETITLDGVTYTRQVTATLVYQVQGQRKRATSPGALIDGGANGGLVGSDAKILETDLLNTADVVGVTDHILSSLPIVQAAAKLDTQDHGPVIGIFSSYAMRSDGGPTVHSKGQMEAFGLIVDDKSSLVGGTQCIITNEGYVVPLHIRQGLPYMPMEVPTQEEMDSLPHVFFTSDSPWDPATLDNEFPTSTCSTPEEATRRQQAMDSRVDAFGQLSVSSLRETTPISSTPALGIQAYSQEVLRQFPDLDSLRPNFGWLPRDRIKATLGATTQHYKATIHHPFRKHFKSRFPAANVRRLPEWVSTDTIFSDTPAHDDGIPGHGSCKMLQLYGGVDSHFLAGYPMRSESDMGSTLEDFIRQHGAMQGLMSDGAKAEIGTTIKNLLRLYCIKDRQSEPHYQHQNHIERRIQDVKRISNTIMDRTGTPAEFWLLCTLYVIQLLNHMINVSGNIPLSQVTGQVTDVSAYLSFHWWQDVLYETPTKQEALGKWVGVSDHAGDALTYLILTHDTQQVIIRSNVRPANEPHHPNRRLLPLHASPSPSHVSGHPILHSLSDALDVDASQLQLPTFSPDELIGRTFIMEGEDGQNIKAQVTRKIMDREAQDHQQIKFLLNCGEDAYEEIISYNALSDLIEQQEQQQSAGELNTWAFNAILQHEGPLKPHQPSYKGSSYNILVEWGDGSETWEPLNLIAKDDPITLARYAKEHNLLDLPGWKFLRKAARQVNSMTMKAKQHRPSRAIKFGVAIPASAKDAIQLDKENGNSLWQDAMDKEVAQLMEYQTFKDGGKDSPPPPGYQMIRVHFVFDCKADGRRKARLVAGGHMTSPPKDSVYSSVVSLRSIRIVCFLAELNNLELMTGDVGNAYLEACTKELVCFRAGPEFGPLAGHTLIIHKALYGLRSSGARFHEKFADTLHALGFTPSYADPDVWLRRAGEVYEYLTIWVDDLLVALKQPQKFMDALQAPPHNYKLKGVGTPKYHLGGDFFHDSDGTLCYGAQTYIKRLAATYTQLFGEPPATYLSPSLAKDHPELDTTESCLSQEVIQFQSLIGALQWTISLCRFDIAHAVMSLSRYKNSPLKGHLDRAKRIVGYLRKYPHACIRFRTGIPYHEEQYGEQPPSHDWMHSVYGSPKEQLPPNAPEPRGNPVRTTTFVDANLMHDYSTGRSATGVLHFLNQTPIDCFSKRQSQLETATYGSEFVAARTGTEQIIDLRFTLRMLGVPLDGPSWMFGDNQSVITSSTIPHSTLSKRWNALSYHRVREAVASGILRFHFIESKQNPADILTKPLSHSAMWPHVDTLFFRKGDTASQGPPHSERGVTIGIDLRTEPNAQEAASRQPSVRFERAKLQI